ncbi:hypothetical protein B0A50_08409 [Salinomyces thailandicus]|uniref:Stress response protein rds1p n=1 Tax=Salinomyces thailandicus TaxID=706561 RepID=A0A4U0TJK5_9PEZI|nr:hypothetical protein B0A50_08409 [Salinomyces thailandica]
MVHLRSAAALALCAGLSAAAPTDLEKRQATNIDTTVLNFALTLEHLENVFYNQALQKFSARDFQKAGYGDDYYNNLKYIAYDEQQHVQLLTNAIQAAGATPVQQCTYNFPYNDVRSFITLSSVLEGVGTSAYLGGAPLITSKQYLTVAGSILAVEALHTSYQRNAINEVPFPNPLYTSLDPTSVFSLASLFIVSCPAGSPPLPFTANPALQVNGDTCTCEEPECSKSSRWHRKGRGWNKGWPKNWRDNSNYCQPPRAGDTASFTAATTDSATLPNNVFVTFVSGLSVTSVPGQVSGSTIKATIPPIAMGQTYVFISKSDVENTFDQSQVLFGPAVLEVAPPPPPATY